MRLEAHNPFGSLVLSGSSTAIARELYYVPVLLESHHARPPTNPPHRLPPGLPVHVHRRRRGQRRIHDPQLQPPHETIYSEAKVSQVIVPGAAGEYGITADHVPIVAQLKPGVLQIMHEGAEPEKYFVAGGFSLTHDNSVTVRLIAVCHCCWFCYAFGFFVLIFVFQ